MAGIIQWITEIDQHVFLFLNRQHTSFGDVVMTLFTQTGFWVLFYLSILIMIIRKYKIKSIIIILLLVLAIVLSDQLSVLVKESVQRLRPTHDPAIQDKVHYVLNKGGFYGFFSSHASNTFALAMFSTLLFRNACYGVLIFLWATVVSYSRIYLGVHFPLDILTGIAFGLLLGFAIYKLLTIIEKNFLLLQSPKISEVRMNNSEFCFPFATLSVMAATTIVVVWYLDKFSWTFS